MFVAFYLLIACVYFTVGNVVSEPLFEDLQDQVFKESQLFFMVNKESHLEHVAPIVNFSMYSIELELQDRKV
jgi:hypothetical protein